MRELLYQAYLRYPRAFYDRHATGQVVSRATNDLYPIRYFIGWGMTQGIQSLMMIVGIAIVLFLVNVKLAALALIAMPFVAVLAFTFGRRVMPVSREVQQLKANVTEAADEAVVGIEMVQAFGREDDVQARFGAKAEARARRRAAPGAHRGGVPAGAALPADALDRRGRLLRRPRRDRRRAHLRPVLPLLPTAPAARLAARGARLDPLARAARDRVGIAQLRVAPGNRDDPRAEPADVAARRRPLGVRFEDVHFSYGSGSEVLSGRPARDRARRGDRDLRPDRRRQDVAAQPAAALLRPDRRPRAHRRRRRARPPLEELRTRGRDRDAEADPLLDPAARQPDRGAARRAVGRGRRRLRGRRRRALRSRAAGRLRHADRRARRQPLGRPAPARRACARARRRRARRRARRPDVGRRHADRAPPRREPPPRARGPHRADRDAAPLDRRGRRPRGRARRRRDRRVRHAEELLARGGLFASLFGEEVSAAA